MRPSPRPPHAKAAFAAALPMLFAYLPLGTAFGILWSRAGLAGWLAPVSGLVVYAGAAQYLSIALLAARMPLAEIFATILILNLRHAFYGFSLLSRYGRIGVPARLYAIFALTDETYSVLTAHPEGDARFCVEVSAFNQLFWVTGCALGGWLGSQLVFETRGFEFVLTALFTVLVVEQARAVRQVYPFAWAALGATIALAWDPSRFLIIALVVVVLGLSAQQAGSQSSRRRPA